MPGKTLHWFREWAFSHLLWEGFKYIIPASWGAAVIALIVATVRSFGGHPNTVLLTGSFLGIVVITGMYVGRENARKVVPVLRLAESRSEGLYDIEPNAIGFTVGVFNDQKKFQTTAHNLKASLGFRHSLGDVVKVFPALWVVGNPATGTRKLSNSVSIGMGDFRSLLIVFWHNSRTPLQCLTTGNIPLSYDDASRLALGEWKVRIVLEGDNARMVSNNKLSLQPHSITMTPA